MHRLLFEKTGRGIYLSHLDTMALFPRAFLRAGLHVQFTQGMSPHAYVSIALPLSVGTASVCELLDFRLEEELPLETLPARLNPKLPAGIRVRSAYESPRKISELRYLRCTVALEYDGGAPAGTAEALTALFRREQLLVEKQTKKGPKETDILPMIRELEISPVSRQELRMEAVICAREPALNPQLMVQAIHLHLPQLAPDFSIARRLEIYDGEMEVFR